MGISYNGEFSLQLVWKKAYLGTSRRSCIKAINYSCKCWAFRINFQKQKFKQHNMSNPFDKQIDKYLLKTNKTVCWVKCHSNQFITHEWDINLNSEIRLSMTIIWCLSQFLQLIKPTKFNDTRVNICLNEIINNDKNQAIHRYNQIGKGYVCIRTAFIIPLSVDATPMIR